MVRVCTGANNYGMFVKRAGMVMFNDQTPPFFTAPPPDPFRDGFDGTEPRTSSVAAPPRRRLWRPTRKALVVPNLGLRGAVEGRPQQGLVLPQDSGVGVSTGGEHVPADQVKALSETARSWAKDHLPDGSLNRTQLARLATFIADDAACRTLLELITKDFGNPAIFTERPAIELDMGPHVSTWILGWRKDEATPIHGHGESAVAVAGYLGRVYELIYGATRSRPALRFVGKRFIGEDSDQQVIKAGREWVHVIGNENEPLAITVHCYSPRLEVMEYFVMLTDGTLAKAARVME